MDDGQVPPELAEQAVQQTAQARAHLAAGRFGHATTTFLFVVRAVPQLAPVIADELAEALDSYARQLVAAGSVDEALAAYKAAIGMLPHVVPRVHFNLGALLYSLGSMVILLGSELRWVIFVAGGSDRVAAVGRGRGCLPRCSC